MTKGEGRLVLVVGPSGAGKDTLIAGARDALAADPRFVFPERLITREALPEAEAHDTISRDGFAQLMAEGRYALAWEAHGLGYVIPIDVAEAVAEGQVAVCNGSRGIVPEALARFPGTHVVHVDADRSVRAQRLMARGRETGEEIACRLARAVPDFDVDVPVTEVDNSGSVAEGIAAFTAALEQIAGAAQRETE